MAYILIKPLKLRKMLRKVSLSSLFKDPLLDPVELRFDNKGLWVCQYSEKHDLAVLANFKPEYFYEYHILPPFQIWIKEVLEDMRKVLKLEKVVKILLDEERIIFKGELEEYSTLRQNTKIDTIDSADITKRDFGLSLKKLKPHKVYKLDLSQLKLMKAEQLTFDYGEKLVASVSVGEDLQGRPIKTYRRRLIYEANSGEGSGRVTLYYDIVEKIVKNMSGLIYLVFTEEGAVVFSQKRGTFTTTYILFPVI